MLTAIVRKEIRETWRDGRFRWTAAAVLTLFLAAVLSSLHYHNSMYRERAEAQARSRTQWIKQEDKNPHMAAHYGVYLFRQPGPLTPFERGVLSFSGASVFVEAHKQNLPTHAAAQDGTLAQRLGEWTPANLLRALIPLLILAMTFGSFASERERGVLLQVQALGVSSMRYAWGKVLGIGISLGVLLIPAALLGITALAYGAGRLDLDIVARVAVMSAAYTVYLAIFVVTGIAVSALAQSTRRALVVLFLIWIAWVLVLPRVAVDAAAGIHPAPRWAALYSNLEREQGLSADSERPYEARVEALRKSLLTRYGVDKVEDLPISFGGAVLVAGEEWGNEAFDRNFNKLYDAYQAQERWIRAGGILTPLLPLQTLSMAMAGNDLWQDVAFRKATESYRRDLVLRMNRNVRDNPRTTGRAYTGSTDLWRTVPPFEYHSPAFSSVLLRHASDLLVLSVWFGVCAAALSMAVRRMDRQVVR